MLLLCCFAHHNRYHDFRVAELEALVKSEGLPASSLWSELHPRPKPGEDSEVFTFCHLQNEELASRIQSRSVLIKSFVQVFARGKDYNELLENLSGCTETFRHYVHDDVTWAYKFVTYNSSSNGLLQQEKMDLFSFLYTGREKVDLDNPDVVISVIEEWKHNGNGIPSLLNVYFGRVVSQRNHACRLWWSKYDLSNRLVLGPTTLDNDLSFLMCNQAGVRPGSVVLDPFVGTGSLLIAASHLKGFCMGSDIDLRVLQGYRISYVNPEITHRFNGGFPDVFKNFKDYQLCRPEIMACDSTTPAWRKPFEKSYASPVMAYLVKANGFHAFGLASTDYRERPAGIKPWVDVIITDPPYGIRAAARKSSASGVPPSETLLKESHEIGALSTNATKKGKRSFSPSSTQMTASIVQNLVELASRLLVDGGRLVFLYPLESRNDFEGVCKSWQLRNTGLELVSINVQQLARDRCRMLVVIKRLSRKFSLENHA